jgi:integrase
MPTRPRKPPSYRLHKPTGQAVVRLDGHDHYLGRFDTPDSHERYHRLVAEWLTSGAARRPDRPSTSTSEISVNELLLAYVRHAEGYYRRPGGSPAPELDNVRLALRPLRTLYGGTPASAFGPAALKAVRQHLVEAGLGIRTVNQRTQRLVRCFRWAAENELIAATVHQALKCVAGLKAGRSAAREVRVVRPVPDDQVDAIRPFLPRQLWAVVELQRLTGMRSGEVLTMLSCDVDTSGKVWVYIPARHKTEHHGKGRRIFLGPRAQAVLLPWLRADPTAFLFQPLEAKEEHLAVRRAGRRTPLTPSQRARRRKADPKRRPGVRYDSRTYNHAVARACERAGIPRWHPHQLRHNAATVLRKHFDLDVARAVLGHGSATVTERYAELDGAKAAEAMREVG